MCSGPRRGGPIAGERAVELVSRALEGGFGVSRSAKDVKYESHDVPGSFKRGSWAPTDAIVCEIERMTSSTVQARTGRRLGASSPVR
mmetsp:Transcript_20821/g.31361  ORF Transcript_20821/g.31361 Transcript_20821/m.31361 type:complete len:87 (-) Transcript_20821:240-500(-)